MTALGLAEGEDGEEEEFDDVEVWDFDLFLTNEKVVRISDCADVAIDEDIVFFSDENDDLLLLVPRNNILYVERVAE